MALVEDAPSRLDSVGVDPLDAPQFLWLKDGLRARIRSQNRGAGYEKDLLNEIRSVVRPHPVGKAARNLVDGVRRQVLAPPLLALTKVNYELSRVLGLLDGNVDCAGNSYLGYEKHPEIQASVMLELLLKRSPARSSVFLREEENFSALQTLLGRQELLFVNSASEANMILVRLFANNFPDTTYIYPREIHFSIKKPIKDYASVGSDEKSFAFEDLDELDRIIEGVQTPAVLFLEGLYSASGNSLSKNLTPRLHQILLKAEAKGVFLIWDEAHSFLVRKETYVQEEGLPKGGATVVSPFKAPGGGAAIIGVDSPLLARALHADQQLVFSSGVSPERIAHLLAMATVHQREGRARAEHCLRMTNALNKALTDAGFHLSWNVGENGEVYPSASFLMHVGSTEATLLFQQFLGRFGVEAASFVFPATPHNGAGVRFSIGQDMTPSKIAYVQNACVQAARILARDYHAPTKLDPTVLQVASAHASEPLLEDGANHLDFVVGSFTSGIRSRLGKLLS